jgi:hypothetical protein
MSGCEYPNHSKNFVDWKSAFAFGVRPARAQRGGICARRGRGLKAQVAGYAAAGKLPALRTGCARPGRSGEGPALGVGEV